MVLFGVLAVCCASAEASDLQPFSSSDGCSLFPDGTTKDSTQWCDCCLSHDIAYWRGGSEEDRKRADEALRGCVAERTGDKALAETMYVGVRTGGHPAFPASYRWAYGWRYGRGYEPLSDAEKQDVRERFDEYRLKQPAGYCGKQSPASAAAPESGRRAAAWATPVPSKHLKNFYRLDDKVLRSAQPDRKGFQELNALGIRSVLSFRDHHSDDDGKGLGLDLYRVRMEAGDIPTGKVIEALRIIGKSEGPILIHCWHGSDRTGLISAMYRIVFQKWSREDAIDKLMNGGYGYHSLYKNIPEFIRQVDIEKVHREVFAQ